MTDCLKFYIDGQWTEPTGVRQTVVVNPATEAVIGALALGTAADVDRAVQAARAAFEGYARWSVEDRVALLSRIVAGFQQRYAELAAAITQEMGAPAALSRDLQAASGIAHFQVAMQVLGSYPFEERRGTTLVAREPIGVCALITPWNWPINQIACKVAPALAVGCTVILKPSEISPLSAQIFTEILDAAGVPPGVFNMVHGSGSEVGAALSAHPDVDMVSFTGSTRAGVDVAMAAASSVKRVSQELGGKSANILLDDADFAAAVPASVTAVMMNSGQSCVAPTRLLVPAERAAEVGALAKVTADALIVGPPEGEVHLGPVASKQQWTKVQRLIELGMSEGATLLAGGPGRPDGLERGFYVKPTVFSDVTQDMTIAREEIFGPVLVIQAYHDEDDAVRIANDSEYGLAGYVQSGSLERARSVARRLRAGHISINFPDIDFTAPFGGYKRSGNGREWGDHGFAEYLETKSVLGFGG